MCSYLCLYASKEQEEWVPGDVVKRIEAEVPNTKVFIVTFDISYSLEDQRPDNDNDDDKNDNNDSNNKLTLEYGIKSDRIRLLAKENGDVIHKKVIKQFTIIFVFICLFSEYLYVC